MAGVASQAGSSSSDSGQDPLADPVVLEDEPCPLGCPRNDRYILSGRDLLQGAPGAFSVVQCRQCGLLRTNPRPTPQSMGRFYPDDYRPFLDTRVNQAQPRARSRFRERLLLLAGHCVRFNVQHWPDLSPGRLLEIGCASGAFLHAMTEKGWQVQGIEFSATAAAAAARSGFPVQTGPLESAAEPEEPFDLIVGWMVLEHLHDPVAALRKLRAWARPGAWLVLSVPNCAAIEFRLFRDKWYSLHLPNHLFHFSPKTLRKVLRAGGWKPERIVHQRVLSNAVASLGHVLRGRGRTRLGEKLLAFPKDQGRWAYVLYPLAWVMSLFGQTGRMTIWARPDR
jgi:2-polyprenyl-3-methyl-5-hydroxy-6-metoxy-1,4-benzoquinol methylase